MNSVAVSGLGKGTYSISELLDLDDMAALSRVVVKGRKRKVQKFPKHESELAHVAVKERKRMTRKLLNNVR